MAPLVPLFLPSLVLLLGISVRIIKLMISEIDLIVKGSDCTLQAYMSVAIASQSSYDFVLRSPFVIVFLHISAVYFYPSVYSQPAYFSRKFIGA